jgi:hypothetical protein
MACGPVVHRGEACLKKSVLCSKQRGPSSLTEATWSRVRRTVMDRVVIGIDPHKRPVTIEARDTREVLRATGRFGSDTGSYRGMLRLARQWPQRVWAIEGANGVGRPGQPPPA